MPELFIKKKLPTRDEVDAFMHELVELCKKHNLSIGHEDHHGGFLIHPYNEYNIDWLKNAVFEEE
jgi:hypothetical protein